MLGVIMSYDLEKLRFGADATTIAEDEFAASFNEDDDNELIELLYKEYQQAGSPMKRKEWLRDRLAELFACVDQRPDWIERSSVPTWPFLGGRPMVFIRQFEVPRTEVSETQIVPLAMLYVFGVRSEQGEGWRTEYRVVEQLSDLP